MRHGRRAETGLGDLDAWRAAMSERALGSPDGVTVVFVDIAEVVTANLSHGWDAGNALIEAQAQRLAAFSAPALVWHLGTDRFVIDVAGVGREARDSRATAIAQAVPGVLSAPVSYRDVTMPTNATAWVLHADGASAPDDLLEQIFQLDASSWASIHRQAQAAFARATSLAELTEVVAIGCVTRLGLAASRVSIGSHLAIAGDVPNRQPDGSADIGADGSIEWWSRGTADLPPSISEPIGAALRSQIDLLRAVGRERSVGETDPLTGLLNRRGFRRAVSSLSAPCAVVIADLDRLKAINDVHGHDAGDRALCQVSNLLLDGRHDDIVARWGGEEFVAVLRDADTDGAAAWLRRLIERSRSMAVGDLEVTFSAGVARCASAAEIEGAITRADRALYEAKRGGRAAVVVA